MTATRIWYPHYVEDFNRKTGHLSLAERGAYRALMDVYWQRQGPLPADERALCRMIGAFPDEWEAVRENVLAFFTEKDGALHNRRCDMELKKARKQYEEKVERIAAARAKREKGLRAARKPSDRSLDQTTELTTGLTSVLTTEQTSVLTSGTPTPSPSPPHGSKEPHNVFLGEAFWKDFPHPPNRGSKRRVVEKINALSVEDQRAALASLRAHKRAIAETRQRHAGFQPCMAETFVNGRRWEAFDSDPPGEKSCVLDVHWPEDEEAKRLATSLQRRIGEGPFASYFGRSPPRKNGEGWVVTPPSRAVADLMENRFGGALNDVYGKGAWRMEG